MGTKKFYTEFNEKTGSDSTDKHLISDPNDSDKVKWQETETLDLDLMNNTNAGFPKNSTTDVSGNSWVLDEDDLISNSATKVATQQSIKTYIDNQGFPAVSDSGISVLSNVTGFDFSTNLNATDDGDGTVTISATDTDTRVNVSNNGTEIETNVTDINFGSGISAVDDGDGSITASTTGAAGVTGPSSSTDNAIARYDGTGGSDIQNSGVLIDDSDNMYTPGTILEGDSNISGFADIQSHTTADIAKDISVGTNGTSSNQSASFNWLTKGDGTSKSGTGINNWIMGAFGASYSNTTIQNWLVLGYNSDGSNKDFIQFDPGNNKIKFPNITLENSDLFTFSSQFDNGNSGTGITIDLSARQQQLVTITDNTTITMDASSLSGPTVIMLEMVIDSTGGYTISFSGIEFEGGSVGTIDNSANSNTFMSIEYDGTTVSGKLVNNTDFS